MHNTRGARATELQVVSRPPPGQFTVPSQVAAARRRRRLVSIKYQHTHVHTHTQSLSHKQTLTAKAIIDDEVITNNKNDAALRAAASKAHGKSHKSKEH